ncbi:S8 family serine peptidase [Oscillatoria salina]|uniref:S8 family serine peptidase n=1 Tax=Oscillatoria salina TaxID=331517 RepID=UPI001CCE2FE5|nr:S8 family serine peptidase [Oscillatoria salina]MBZ8180510.1 S8 family serine peptidase [Oscillatoria salina IIICB1]
MKWWQLGRKKRSQAKKTRKSKKLAARRQTFILEQMITPSLFWDGGDNDFELPFLDILSSKQPELDLSKLLDMTLPDGDTVGEVIKMSSNLENSPYCPADGSNLPSFSHLDDAPIATQPPTNISDFQPVDYPVVITPVDPPATNFTTIAMQGDRTFVGTIEPKASVDEEFSQQLREFVDAARSSGQKNAVVHLNLNLTEIGDEGEVIPRSLLTPAEREALAYAQDNQIIVVVAAGDNPETISSLGQMSREYDNIITVGAATKISPETYQIADYSGRGEELDILAEGICEDDETTAVAASWLSGAISKVWATNPELNYTQVIDLIKATATNLATLDVGLLNVTAAVEKAKLTTPEPYLPKISLVAESNRTQTIVLSPEKPNLTLNLSEIFIASKGQPLQYELITGDSSSLALQLEDNLLQLNALPKNGTTAVAIRASDEAGNSLLYSFDVITNNLSQEKLAELEQILSQLKDVFIGDDLEAIFAHPSVTEAITFFSELIAADETIVKILTNPESLAELGLSDTGVEVLQDLLNRPEIGELFGLPVSINEALNNNDQGLWEQALINAQEAYSLLAENFKMPSVGLLDFAGEHGENVAQTLASINPQLNYETYTINESNWAEELTKYVNNLQATGEKQGIVNLSFDLTQIDDEGKTTTRYELTPAEQEAIKYAQKHNVLLVVAAGNTGDIMSALGKAAIDYDNIITVGAVNKWEEVADYSAQGEGLTLVAPGGQFANDPDAFVGTSRAAAYVTGAASLIWAVNPDLNYQQVKELLVTTAKDLGAEGWDNETGSGLLDVTEAVLMAYLVTPEELTATDVPEITNFSGTGRVIPLERAASPATEAVISTLNDTQSNLFAQWQLLNNLGNPDLDLAELDLIVEQQITEGLEKYQQVSTEAAITKAEWEQLTEALILANNHDKIERGRLQALLARQQELSELLEQLQQQKTELSQVNEEQIASLENAIAQTELEIVAAQKKLIYQLVDPKTLFTDYTTIQEEAIAQSKLAETYRGKATNLAAKKTEHLNNIQTQQNKRRKHLNLAQHYQNLLPRHHFGFKRPNPYLSLKNHHQRLAQVAGKTIENLQYEVQIFNQNQAILEQLATQLEQQANRLNNYADFLDTEKERITESKGTNEDASELLEFIQEQIVQQEEIAKQYWRQAEVAEKRRKQNQDLAIWHNSQVIQKHLNPLYNPHFNKLFKSGKQAQEYYYTRHPEHIGLRNQAQQQANSAAQERAKLESFAKQAQQQADALKQQAKALEKRIGNWSEIKQAIKYEIVANQLQLQAEKDLLALQTPLQEQQLAQLNLQIEQVENELNKLQTESLPNQEEKAATTEARLNQIEEQLKAIEEARLTAKKNLQSFLEIDGFLLPNQERRASFQKQVDDLTEEKIKLEELILQLSNQLITNPQEKVAAQLEKLQQYLAEIERDLSWAQLKLEHLNLSAPDSPQRLKIDSLIEDLSAYLNVDSNSLPLQQYLDFLQEVKSRNADLLTGFDDLESRFATAENEIVEAEETLSNLKKEYQRLGLDKAELDRNIETQENLIEEKHLQIEEISEIVNELQNKVDTLTSELEIAKEEPFEHLTNSKDDFSLLNQGENNWYYGYYRDGRFVPFTKKSKNSWFGREKTHRIEKGGGHPSTNSNAVSRWISDREGTINIQGNLAKADVGGGDGIVGKIIVDGQVVWKQRIEPKDSVGVDYNLNFKVKPGSNVDLVIGRYRSIFYDATKFTADIKFDKVATLEERLEAETNQLNDSQTELNFHLENELKNLSESLEQLKEQTNQIEDSLSDKYREIELVEEYLQQVYNEIDRLESRLDVLNQTKVLEANYQNQSEEWENAIASQISATEALLATRQAGTSDRAQLLSLESQLNELENNLASSQQEQQQFEQEIADTQEALEFLESVQLDNQKIKLQSLIEQDKDLRNNEAYYYSLAQQKLQQIWYWNGRTYAYNPNAAKAYRAHLQRASLLADQRNKLSQQRQETKSKIAELEEQLTALKAQLAAQNNSLENTTQKVEELTAEKTVLENAIAPIAARLKPLQDEENAQRQAFQDAIAESENANNQLAETTANQTVALEQLISFGVLASESDLDFFPTQVEPQVREFIEQLQKRSQELTNQAEQFNQLINNWQAELALTTDDSSRQALTESIEQTVAQRDTLLTRKQENDTNLKNLTQRLERALEVLKVLRQKQEAEIRQEILTNDERLIALERLLQTENLADEAIDSDSILGYAQLNDTVRQDLVEGVATWTQQLLNGNQQTKELGENQQNLSQSVDDLIAYIEANFADAHGEYNSTHANLRDAITTYGVVAPRHDEILQGKNTLEQEIEKIKHWLEQDAKLWSEIAPIAERYGIESEELAEYQKHLQLLAEAESILKPFFELEQQKKARLKLSEDYKYFENPDNGNRYFFTKANTTWHAAQTEAKKLEGNLVTIRNDAEQQFLREKVGKRSVWIGLTDAKKENEWRWVSGEPVDYTNFYPGQPDNAGGKEDWTEFHGQGSGKWNDTQNRNGLSQNNKRGLVEVSVKDLEEKQKSIIAELRQWAEENNAFEKIPQISHQIISESQENPLDREKLETLNQHLGGWYYQQDQALADYYEEQRKKYQQQAKIWNSHVNDFNSELYLRYNPDVYYNVAIGKIGSAPEHYLNHGLSEGRFANPEAAHNRDIARAKAEEAAKLRDIALQFPTAKAYRRGFLNDPLNEHYLSLIAEDQELAKKYEEERKQYQSEADNFYARTKIFNERAYLEKYPDVAKAVRKGGFKSGLEHYVKHGIFEKRLANPAATAKYEEAQAKAKEAAKLRDAALKFTQAKNYLENLEISFDNGTAINVLQEETSEEQTKYQTRLNQLQGNLAQNEAQSAAVLAQANWYEKQAAYHWQRSLKLGPTWTEERKTWKRGSFGKKKDHWVTITHIDHHWILWDTYTKYAQQLRSQALKQIRIANNQSERIEQLEPLLEAWTDADNAANNAEPAIDASRNLLEVLETAREQIPTVQEQLQILEDLLPTLQEELTTAKQETANYQAQIAANNQAYDSASLQYRQAIADILARRGELNNQSQQLQHQLGDIEQWVEQQSVGLATELAQVQALHTQLSAQTQQLTNQISTATGDELVNLQTKLAQLQQTLPLLENKAAVLTSQQTAFTQKRTLLTAQNEVIIAEQRLLDAYLLSPDTDFEQLQEQLQAAREALAEAQRLAEQAEASSQALSEPLQELQGNLIAQNDEHLKTAKEHQTVLKELLEATELQANYALQAAQQQQRVNNLEFQILQRLQEATKAGSQEAKHLLQVAQHNNIATAAEIYYRDYSDLASDKGSSSSGGIATEQDRELADSYYHEMLVHRQFQQRAQAQANKFKQIRETAQAQMKALQKQQDKAIALLNEINEKLAVTEAEKATKEQELALAQARLDGITRIRQQTEQTFIQLVSIEQLNLAQAQLEQQIAAQRQADIEQTVQARLEREQLELERQRLETQAKLEQLRQLQAEEDLRTTLNQIRTDVGFASLEGTDNPIELQTQMATLLTQLEELGGEQLELPENLQALLAEVKGDIHLALQGEEAENIQENLLRATEALVGQVAHYQTQIFQLELEEQWDAELLQLAEEDLQQASQQLLKELERAQELGKERQVIEPRYLETLTKVANAKQAVDISQSLAAESRQILAQIIDQRVAERKARKKYFWNEMLGMVSIITSLLGTILSFTPLAPLGYGLMAVSGIISGVQAVMNGDWLGGIFNVVMSVVSGLTGGLGSAGLISKAIMNTIQGIQAAVGGVFAGARSLMSGESILGALQILGSFASFVTTGLSNVVNNLTGQLQQVMYQVFNSLQKVPVMIYKGVKAIESGDWFGAISNIFNTITTLGKNFGSFFGDTVSTVFDYLSKAGNSALTITGAAMGGTLESVLSGLDGLLNIWRDDISGLVDNISGKDECVCVSKDEDDFEEEESEANEGENVEEGESSERIDEIEREKLRKEFESSEMREQFAFYKDPETGLTWDRSLLIAAIDTSNQEGLAQSSSFSPERLVQEAELKYGRNSKSGGLCLNAVQNILESVGVHSKRVPHAYQFPDAIKEGNFHNYFNEVDNFTPLKDIPNGSIIVFDKTKNRLSGHIEIKAATPKYPTRFISDYQQFTRTKYDGNGPAHIYVPKK